jgi:hypothetical protein
MTQNVMDSGDLNAYSEGKLDALSQILHVHYPLTGWCAGNESRFANLNCALMCITD